MLRLILFWLLRIMAVTFPIVNLVYLEVNGVWGIVVVILSILACTNLYIWGQFSRETNKKTPGMFIMIRVVQGVIVFIFDAMAIKYYATYLVLDIIYYSVLMYDTRYKFIYKEPRTEKNSRIRRV